MNIDLAVVARDLRLPPDKLAETVKLLDDGNTIPFITRFRKDLTGGLDENQILSIKQKVAQLRTLAERKAFVLKSIESQGKLTDELRAEIDKANSARSLEDIYRPFKARKQSRATTARQQGLEPLAQDILNGHSADENLTQKATQYVRVDKGLESVDDVIRGVGDLLVEQFSDNQPLRNDLRQIMWATGKLKSSLIPKPDSSQDDPAPPETDAEPPETDPAAMGDNKDQPDQPDQPLSTELVAAEAASDDATESAGPAESIPATDDASAEITQQFAEISKTVRQPAISEAEGKKKRKKKKKKKKKVADDPFKDYHDFNQPLNRVPNYRVLAINRGERNGTLRVRIEADQEKLVKATTERLVPAGHPFAEFLKKSAIEMLNRVLLPSLEREIRRELTETAERHAVGVFANNVRSLLLQPPLRDRRVLAIDPGFKRGCSVAMLDAGGAVLDSGHIFVVGNKARIDESRKKLVDWASQHQIDVIAIGNGAACRHVEQLVSEIVTGELADKKIGYVIVNESGASVYSTSETGREELPDHSPSIRSAVSIGRRLQDPLSELVKISPANIGVGMYQHDARAKHLEESLDEVVQFCVNRVGVNVNTASPALLKYVSGLNALTARRIFEHRQQIGRFSSRQQLREVSGFGDATFLQAAGFLRVYDGDTPLDSTAIHPESYALADAILSKAETTCQQLLAAGKDCGGQEDGGQEDDSREDGGLQRKEAVGRLAELKIESLAEELGSGDLLIRDILLSLKNPAWDPRDRLSGPVFRRGIVKVDDLEPGMSLDAQVVNVVDFGVFVDIGLGESCLVHVSELSHNYIRDPHDHFAIGQPIRVWVAEIDSERRRVKLTAKKPGSKKPSRRSRGNRQSESGQPRSESRRHDRSGQSPGGSHRKPAGKKHERRPRSSSSSRPARPKPVKPITDEMLAGNEPMRSFSDLMQFVSKKPQDKGKKDD